MPVTKILLPKLCVLMDTIRLAIVGQQQRATSNPRYYDHFGVPIGSRKSDLRHVKVPRKRLQIR